MQTTQASKSHTAQRAQFRYPFFQISTSLCAVSPRYLDPCCPHSAGSAQNACVLTASVRAITRPASDRHPAAHQVERVWVCCPSALLQSPTATTATVKRTALRTDCSAASASVEPRVGDVCRRESPCFARSMAHLPATPPCAQASRSPSTPHALSPQPRVSVVVCCGGGDLHVALPGALAAARLRFARAALRRLGVLRRRRR